MVHPIRSLGSPQVKSHPNAFGFRVPNRWFTRFAAWVVLKSNHTPTRLDSGFPNRWFTRFAAWVVPKSDHPSTCLDSRFQTVGSPDLQLGKSPSPITPQRIWIQASKPLVHRISSLGSPQVKSPLNVFGFKVPNRWFTRFAAWVVPKRSEEHTSELQSP